MPTRVRRQSRLVLEAVILLGAAARPCLPDILYQVTADTSAASGVSGYLDFQFDPGRMSQPAFVQILSFTPGAALSGVPQIKGAVTGTLPGPVQIDNTNALNDYFQAFDYGNSLSFFLNFGGPAINNPDGTSTSGSSFGLSFCNDVNCASPLLTTDPNGFAAVVRVNLDGTTKVVTYPAGPGGVPPAVTFVAAEAVPEPAPVFLWLVTAGMAVMTRAASKKRNAG